MNTKSKRPYKEALPKNTIQKIKGILNGIDILTTETTGGNPFNEVYSVRVQAIDDDGGFGQNGKGRNQLFCLASAYAEYVERIQNLLLTGISGFNRVLMEKNFKETNLYFYPDEKEITKEEFLKLPKELLSDFFPTKNEEQLIDIVNHIFETVETNNHQGLLGVPFYSLNQRKIIHIPHNFLFSITGSNGMAAGNTLSEAIFQSLCEIYERNSASVIYNERITPPTIDKEFLSNFPNELNIIIEIENKGFEVIVKDFSCGKKLPVLGLIIIDKKSRKYKLNIGSDTNFQVALSRTLTEIFQGLKDESTIEKSLLSIPSKESAPYFYQETNETIYEKEKNFVNFLKNGSGIFPESLFYDNPSYSFDSNIFTSKDSYEEEVKSLLDLAVNLNYNIFIRDVSFLGFPTVYIYISGVSLLGNKFNIHESGFINEKTVLQNDLENLLFPFEDFIANKNKIIKAIDMIESLELMINEDFKAKDLFRLGFREGTKWNELPISFIMVIFSYLANDYVKAKSYLTIFMKKLNLESNEYYLNIMKLIDCKISNISLKEISEVVIDGFKDTESIFKYIGYPICPNCSECSLSEICTTKINLVKYSNIKQKFKENLINQNKFSTL